MNKGTKGDTINEVHLEVTFCIYTEYNYNCASGSSPSRQRNINVFEFIVQCRFHSEEARVTIAFRVLFSTFVIISVHTQPGYVIMEIISTRIISISHLATNAHHEIIIVKIMVEFGPLSAYLARDQ